MMAWISIQARSYGGGVHWGELTGEAWLRFLFERELDDSLTWSFNYLAIIARSVWLSLITTVFSLLVGFPTAFFMATRPRKWRTLLVFMVTLPFWTNLLVRNYAWILILRDHGTINGLLLSLGIIDQPLPLLHNQFAVAVGLTYSFLPFMVLPIYSTLEKLDYSLVEAALDLGCTRLSAFWKVTMPLAIPGIVAGCLLVFIPAVGEFVIPDLLGGSRTLMIGKTLWSEFFNNRDWPLSSAVAVLLLLVLVIPIALFQQAQARAQEREKG